MKSQNRFLSTLLIFVFFLMVASCTRQSNTNTSAPSETAAVVRSPLEKGKLLYSAKGCIACHSIDGTRITGPSFKGIFGTETKLADGSKVKVDEAYVRESIEYPQAKLVEGYPPTMPSFKGIVSDDEITALTEYIKSLK